MPTKNPRLNITLDPAIAAILASFAKREKKSVSSVAMELILTSLERHEDMALSEIARLRDVRGTKTVKHSNAWL